MSSGQVLEGPSAGSASGRLGDFDILREVGRGGMGIVYRARQVSLAREVALKILPGLRARDPRALERFLREARAASQLDHPGICPVYQAGEAGGYAFIAMRFIDGATLSSRIAERRDPPSGSRFVSQVDDDGETTLRVTARPGGPEALRRHPLDLRSDLALVEKAARALHHAHSRGVIHRDVKPGNIIVTAGGEPVVLDFGLALFVSGDATALTATGDVMGTPVYMSPEQITGRSSALDARTDIYSLGVTLYELLTLERPFSGDSREAIYRQILLRDPVPLRRLDPRIPRDVETVCLKAMARDPDRRYATAADFADDLRRLLDLAPIHARPVGRATRAWLLARRFPVPTALAVLLLAAGTTALLLFLARRSDRKALFVAARAEASALLEGGDPDSALRVIDRALARGAPLHDLLEPARRAVDRRALLRGLREAHLIVFDQGAGAGELERADAMAEAAARRLAGVEAFEATFLRAGAAFRRRDLPLALRRFREALALRGVVLDSELDTEVLRLAARTLERSPTGSVLATVDLDAAVTPDDSAVTRSFLSVAGRHAAESPEMAYLLGALLHSLGAHRDALRFYTMLLDREPSHFWGLWMKAHAFAALGERQAALEVAETAVAVESPDPGPAALFLRAVMAERRGDPVRARSDLDRALAADGEFVHALLLRARVLERLEAPEEALHDLDRAVELDPARALAARARFRFDRQNAALAVTDLEARAALPDAPSGPVASLLARALHGVGRHAEALRAAGEALVADPADPSLRLLRSLIHEALGNRTAAARDADLARRVLRRRGGTRTPEERRLAETASQRLSALGPATPPEDGEGLRHWLRDTPAAVALDGPDMEARLSLAAVLSAEGRDDDALALLDGTFALARRLLAATSSGPTGPVPRDVERSLRTAILALARGRRFEDLRETPGFPSVLEAGRAALPPAR